MRHSATPPQAPANRASRRALRSIGIAATAAIAAGGVILPSAANAEGAEPIIHYTFDQASGTTIADETGNGNTATLQRSGASFGDGALSLPGGSNTSAPYVQIPTTALVGEENLTVSTWLSPTSGSGNVAAAFIGAPVAAGQANSASYWLLNPTNLSGYVKSVITNASNPSAPWNTEVGAGATATPTLGARTPAGLSLYTTVINGAEGKLDVYLNGALISSTPITRDVADFGPQLVSYLGRSTYPDAGWAGAIDDFAVYDQALDAEAVQALFTDQALERALASVSVQDTAAADFTLPTSAAGVTVTWESDSEAITIDGANARVTRPGAGAGDASVTLTATFRIGEASETREFTVTVPQQLSDEQRATADADAIEIAGADNVRSNVSVPSLGANGSTIAWSIASGDASLRDGVREDSRTLEVQRPAAGDAASTVELTATIVNGGVTLTRSFELTVQPVPDAAEDEAYVWAFFTGEGQGAEKISLAASKGNDALSWNTLNNGAPLFTSDKGTQGLRDPFIIRSPEGDRFYMLATDLKIDGLPGGFTTAQISGSKHIEVWESDDLVHWSEQRHVQVSSDFAGNTWAPEAFWDEELDTFVVFWASNLYPTDDVADRTGVTYNRMMYVTTDDFRTFSEPQIWSDVRRGAGLGLIDSSVAKVDGTYYRFTKDEASMTIRSEKSTDLLDTYSGSMPGTTGADDEWTLIQERVASGLPNGAGGTYTSGEGPSVFPANEGDVNGYEWFLFIDQPNYHGGPNHYVPFAIDDLDDTDWTPLGDKLRQALPQNADGGKPRHGTVVPVTRDQYQQVLEAYAPGIAVTSVGALSVSTEAGTAPELPQAELTTATGSTKRVDVDWDDIAPSQYAQAGSFTVAGVAQDDSRMPVQLQVTVTDAASSPVTLSATTRCVAGKIVLVSSVTNTGDAPATVDVVSPYGTKSGVTVAAGKTVSSAFSSRLVTIPAGTITVSDGDGDVSVEYPAASCG